jgi:cell division protein FtsB
MTEPDTKTERTARIVIAVLGVIAALLGTLTAYLAAAKSDVVQQRNEVRSDVSTLATQQLSLQEQVARLRRENADLERQLNAASSDSGPTTTDVANDFALRRLNLPLPDAGAMGLFLDDGRVGTDPANSDFEYKRQDATGRPQLVAHFDDRPYSTAVRSAALSKEDCSRAVTTSPTIEPIRPLHSGLLICVLTEGGTSLLRILAAPQKDGILRISQKYWPNQE